MKKLFSILVVLLIFPGPCWAKGYEVKGKAEGYAVVVTFDKSRPVTGTNRIEIAVMDAESRTVRDARVHVEYFMPSLGGKPPMMNYTTTAKPTGDRYEATIDLHMKGAWKVTLSIEMDNHTKTMTFDFVLE